MATQVSSQFDIVHINTIIDNLQSQSQITFQKESFRINHPLNILGINKIIRTRLRQLGLDQDILPEKKDEIVKNEIIGPIITNLFPLREKSAHMLILSALAQGISSKNTSFLEEPSAWLQSTEEFLIYGYVTIYSKRNLLHYSNDIEQNFHLHDITDRIAWCGQPKHAWRHIWDHYQIEHYHYALTELDEVALAFYGVYRTLQAYARHYDGDFHSDERMYCGYVPVRDPFTPLMIMSIQQSLFYQTDFTMKSILQTTFNQFVTQLYTKIKFEFPEMDYLTKLYVNENDEYMYDIQRAEKDRYVFTSEEISFGGNGLTDSITINELPNGRSIRNVPALTKLPLKYRYNVPLLLKVSAEAGLNIPIYERTDNQEEYMKLEFYEKIAREYNPTNLHRHFFDKDGLCFLKDIEAEIVTAMCDRQYQSPINWYRPTGGNHNGMLQFDTNITRVLEYRTNPIIDAYAQIRLVQLIWNYIYTKEHPDHYTCINLPIRLTYVEKVFDGLLRFNYHKSDPSAYGETIPDNDIFSLDTRFLIAVTDLQTDPADYFTLTNPTHALVEFTGYSSGFKNVPTATMYESIFNYHKQAFLIEFRPNRGNVNAVLCQLYGGEGNFLSNDLPVTDIYGDVRFEVNPDSNELDYLTNIIHYAKVSKKLILNDQIKYEVSGRIAPHRVDMYKRRRYYRAMNREKLDLLSFSNYSHTTSIHRAEALLSGFIRLYIQYKLIDEDGTQIIHDYGSGEGYYYGAKFKQYHLFDRYDFNPLLPNVMMHVGEVITPPPTCDIGLAINSLFLLTKRPIVGDTKATLRQIFATHFEEHVYAGKTLIFTLPIMGLTEFSYTDLGMIEFARDGEDWLRLSHYDPVIIFKPAEFSDFKDYISNIPGMALRSVIPSDYDLLYTMDAYGLNTDMRGYNMCKRLRTVLMHFVVHPV